MDVSTEYLVYAQAAERLQEADAWRRGRGATGPHRRPRIRARPVRSAEKARGLADAARPVHDG